MLFSAGIRLWGGISINSKPSETRNLASSSYVGKCVFLCGKICYFQDLRCLEVLKKVPPPPPSQHHQHSDDDSRAPLFFVDAVSKAFFVPLYYMLTQKRPHQIWHLFVLIVFISGAAFVFPATTENLGDNSYSKRTSTTCEESPPF